MTYALACARPTVFRAVAVYSGANLSGCSGGTQPVAYIGLHGIRDNVLPISSGRALRDTFVREQRLHPAEPARAGERQPDAHRHRLLRVPYRVPGRLGRVRRSGPRPRPDRRIAPVTAGTPGPPAWCGASSPSSSPAPRPPARRPPAAVGPGQPEIVGQQSGRCLDVTELHARPTAPRRSCGTATAARTSSGPTPPASSSGVRRQVPGRLGTGHRHGTAVIIWDCNGQANQQWNVNTNGTITGVQSGLCLDANGAGTANGTQIQLWTCSGGATSSGACGADTGFGAGRRPSTARTSRHWLGYPFEVRHSTSRWERSHIRVTRLHAACSSTASSPTASISRLSKGHA